ncbi:MAG: hypothetical protein AAF636_08830 [Pseudomonadota bacterium]
MAKEFKVSELEQAKMKFAIVEDSDADFEKFSSLICSEVEDAEIDFAKANSDLVVGPRLASVDLFLVEIKFDGTVRRQSFSDFLGRFVTEALIWFLFEFRRLQLGAATGVF